MQTQTGALVPIKGDAKGSSEAAEFRNDVGRAGNAKATAHPGDGNMSALGR